MGHTVTSKGQVTIPKAVRDMLGVGPGSEVEFALEDGKIVIRKAGERGPLKSPLAKMRGVIDLGMTTDEFMRELRGDPAEDPPAPAPQDARALLRRLQR